MFILNFLMFLIFYMQFKKKKLPFWFSLPFVLLNKHDIYHIYKK